MSVKKARLCAGFVRCKLLYTVVIRDYMPVQRTQTGLQNSIRLPFDPEWAKVGTSKPGIRRTLLKVWNTDVRFVRSDLAVKRDRVRA